VADTDGISRCFDRCCRMKARRGRPGRVRGVSKKLLSMLEEAGLRDAAVLELGCGTGALTRETVVLGASRATGIDLSPASVEEAGRRAEETGLGDRIEFQVGDGATIATQPHDVVVLDKVICCYPRPDALLANSIPAAGRVYAFVAPVSWGWRRVVAKAGLGVVNAIQLLTRQTFRVFVHDLREIEARLAADGFERTAAGTYGMWYAALHTRRPV
jgi:magnesium-protoporphyrin O-methyltransferase